MISGLTSLWHYFGLTATETKVHQARWLDLRSSCMWVCMYWTLLTLVRPAASLYSASPLKHYPTGKQWCPNPDHYPDSQPASRSLTLMYWALSRAAEPQILTSFVRRGRGENIILRMLMCSNFLCLLWRMMAVMTYEVYLHLCLHKWAPPFLAANITSLLV